MTIGVGNSSPGSFGEALLEMEFIQTASASLAGALTAATGTAGFVSGKPKRHGSEIETLGGTIK